MIGLFIFQIALFSLFPLYFTTLDGPKRQVSFYINLSLVLLIGGFFGNVYSLPLGHGIHVSGGDLCYGAFMMTSVLFLFVEKDLFIFRHIIRLVIFVDFFNVIFSSLVSRTLETTGIINPYQTASGLFEISTFFIILGGVLIILELLMLLFIFDKLKQFNFHPLPSALGYIIVFISVLCLDGIVFSLMAFGGSDKNVATIWTGLVGRLITACAFSVPLLLFAVVKRHSFISYLQTDMFRWHLLLKTSSQLIAEMSHNEYGLKQAAAVFENVSEGLAFVGDKGCILRANRSFCHMLGLNVNTQYQSIQIDSLFRHHDSPLEYSQVLQEKWRGEVSFGRENKHQGLLSVTKVKSKHHRTATFVFSLVNIDEQKEIQKKLNYLARYDQLTHLPNRWVLDEHMAQAEGSRAALLVIDLDHFKDVNDSFGHATGDLILQIVAGRLVNVVQGKSKQTANSVELYRTGGDEFALLLRAYDDESISQIITNIQKQMKKVFTINSHVEVFLSASIGASFKAKGEQRDLLQEADAAMFEAKRNRRGSFFIYEDRLIEESQRKLTLSSRLKAALDSRNLQVYYQPQYDPYTQCVMGVEALARWYDVALGWISPEEFISVAEETGLIERLGDYILEQACIDGAAWLKQGLPIQKLSVNVSPYQLRFGQFVTTLNRVLKSSGFPAHLLVLELTESVYIEREQEVLPLLTRLHQSGIGLAIDDFGTGYSSLSYLSKLPWDTLKIDRSFVSQVPYNAEQCKLTSTIIKMAHDLGLTVIVEGIETTAQLNFVTEQGGELVQGYYYSVPLPAQQIVSLLREKVHKVS